MGPEHVMKNLQDKKRSHINNTFSELMKEINGSLEVIVKSTIRHAEKLEECLNSEIRDARNEILCHEQIDNLQENNHFSYQNISSNNRSDSMSLESFPVNNEQMERMYNNQHPAPNSVLDCNETELNEIERQQNIFSHANNENRMLNHRMADRNNNNIDNQIQKSQYLSQNHNAEIQIKRKLIDGPSDMENLVSSLQPSFIESIAKYPSYAKNLEQPKNLNHPLVNGLSESAISEMDKEGFEDLVVKTKVHVQIIYLLTKDKSTKIREVYEVNSKDVTKLTKCIDVESLKRVGWDNWDFIFDQMKKDAVKNKDNFTDNRILCPEKVMLLDAICVAKDFVSGTIYPLEFENNEVGKIKQKVKEVKAMKLHVDELVKVFKQFSNE